MVTLIDLVDADFMRSLLLASAVNILPYCAYYSGILVPSLVARCMLSAMRFSIQAFLVYLSVGPVLQYIHVVKKSPSPFGDISDSSIQRGIRVAVFSASLFLTGWTDWTDAGSSKLLSLLTTGRTTSGDHSDASRLGIHVVNSLIAASLVVHFLMKVLILLRKKKSDLNMNGKEESGEGGGNSDKDLTINVYLVVSFFCFLVISSIVVVSVMDRGIGWDMVVQVGPGIGNMCIFMPACFVWLNGKIRAFVKDKAKALTGKCSCRNSVGVA